MTKNKLVLFGIFFSLVSCRFNYTNIEYERAKKSIEQKNFVAAIDHYSKLIKRNPESELAITAAREASRISLLNTQQFFKAIGFFRHLLLYSPNSIERQNAQEQIAFIYYEKLSNYKQAIVEYYKLLVLPIDATKKFEYRFNVAKSYYYLNDFKQSLVELDSLIQQEVAKKSKFNLLYFKSNVLIATKEIEKAIEVYKYLVSEFPVLSRNERVGISIAIAYEDLNEFERAIEVLKEIRPFYPDTQFIDIKITRLQQRLANLPSLRKRRGSKK